MTDLECQMPLYSALLKRGGHYNCGSHFRTAPTRVEGNCLGFVLFVFVRVVIVTRYSLRGLLWHSSKGIQ